MAKKNKKKNTTVQAKSKAAAAPAPTKEFAMKKNDWVAVIIALLVTLVCFIAVRDFEFVNWDDDKNFYENELITSLNSDNFWDNTKAIFQQRVIGNYNPLSVWSFLIDNKIHGLDNTGAWHMTNVYLHLLCVLFVFLIGRRLGLQSVSALLLALLFGIHPMRVESVAWVTERKDVLFGVFYLSAIWNYLRYQDEGKSRFLGYMYLLFILSLFSKIQAVSLPLSLIAIDYFRSGAFSKQSILTKVPLFAMSLAFGLAGLYFLDDQGSLTSQGADYPLWQRIFVGSFGLMIYLIKVIVPWKMSPLYPYESEFPSYYYPTGIVYLIVAAALYYAYKKRMKAVVFGLLFFMVNVVFLLQILGAGQGLAADRFTYIAYFGLFFIAAYYFQQALDNPKFKKMAQAGALVAVLCYAGLTIRQVNIWQNSGTLWTHVLKYYNKVTLPWGNRANYYRTSGQINKALADYNKAIELQPSAQTYNSRARLFFDKGATRDTLMLALKDYNSAIEMDQTDGEFYINRGATYARLGDNQSAINDLNKGLELKPDHATGYLNRSVLNNMMAKYPAALADLEKYVEFYPYKSDIWYEIGRVKRNLQRHTEALQDYNKAIQLATSASRGRNAAVPNIGLYYYERSRTNALLNNIAQAKSDLLNAESSGYRKVDQAFKQQLMSLK